jgi:hypothetical protein
MLGIFLYIPPHIRAPRAGKFGDFYVYTTALSRTPRGNILGQKGAVNGVLGPEKGL